MARRGKDRSRGTGKFARLPFYLLESQAWKALEPNARALYLELLHRFNGHNNGSIGLGVREAGESINVKKSTASRAFDTLMELGFIDIAKASSFGQKRLAREWLLTDLYNDRTGEPARKDFMRWRPKKQNPVPQKGHPVPPAGHQDISAIQKPAHSSRQSGPQSQQRDYGRDSLSHESDTYRYTTPGRVSNA